MGDAPDFDRDDRPRTAQPPPIRRPGALVVHEEFAQQLRAEGYSELADDLCERGEYGARKYATADGPCPLTVDNGRDPLADAYEEFLDALAYLAQETMRAPTRWARDYSVAYAVLWPAAVLAEQVRVALANRPAAAEAGERRGPFADWVTEWEHVDGTPCDAGFMAPTREPESSPHWWCTEHGERLRAR